MTRIPILRLAVALAALPAIAPPAIAQVFDGPEAYRACMIIAREKPETGWEEAIAWQSLGGGEPARHCAALALIGLGKHAEAATRLETLANESKRDDPTRSEMFAQAAQAWIMDGNLPRADSAQRAAMFLAPDNLEIRMDHAVLMAQLGYMAEANALLSDVLTRQPNRVEALVLRASARRTLDDLAGAGADVSRAVELDPGFADALLERGMLRRLGGDEAGARQDWLAVIAAQPDAAAADLARRNLELLDVKGE